MSRKIAFALCSLVLAAGCRSREREPTPSASESRAPLALVSIPQVSEFVRDRSAVIVDTNSTETRKELGIIPGAILLSSHDEYALSELPSAKSKKLVFYCGSTSCTASHVAAARASKAGYTDVAVLPDGIRGWKKAGQPTDSPRS
jgi:rhodanese-related sulfurtransferase